MGILGKILKAAAPEQYAKYKVKVKHYDNARHLAITFNKMRVTELANQYLANSPNYNAHEYTETIDRYKMLKGAGALTGFKTVVPELSFAQKIGLWREAGREGLSARALQAALDGDQNARFVAPPMELPIDADDSFILGAKTIADTWVAKERLAAASSQEARFKESPVFPRSFAYHTMADEEASEAGARERGKRGAADAAQVVTDYFDNPAAYHKAGGAHYEDRKPAKLPKRTHQIIPSSPRVVLPGAVGSDSGQLGIRFDTAKMSEQFVRLVLTQGIRAKETVLLRSELIGAGRLNYNHLARTKSFSPQARYDAIENAYWGAKAAASLAHYNGDIAGYAKHSADYLVAKGARMACFEHLHDLGIPVQAQ